MAAKKTKPRASSSSAGSGPKAKASSRAQPPERLAVKDIPPKASVAKPPKVASPKVASPNFSGAGQLAEGSKAPAFALSDETGKVVTSASLAGKPYVLYFYPKDDTPGCTAEACDFRDNLRAFNGQKVRVIGVSPDDQSRHAKFKEKYGLTFTLLSDSEKSLVNAYGVWVEKQNYGRKYMGVERSTFVIDGSGKIKKVWRRVRVPGHVADVLASL